MVVKKIDIEELREYVYNALLGDEELIRLFDRKANVVTTLEAAEKVIEKIETVYWDADLYGVEIEGEPHGYFACKNNLLISFGMNILYRNKMVLSKFWGAIKDKMSTSDFQCVLYSSNSRGIKWLQKCGMKIYFDNVTILTYN